MSDTTATPETGTVDAPSSMESILAEFDKAPSENAAIEDVTATLVKELEDDGHADKAPVTEKGETDPTAETKEPTEATPEELDTDAEPKADDPTYKVKVNGEEHDVPLSELQKGYSRTEDYKAKTMALADERRALEAQRATVEQTVQQQYATELKRTIDNFEALDPVLMEARQIDWDKLKVEDPATFVKYSDAVQQRLNLIEQHRAQIAQIEQQRTQASQQQEQAQREQRMNLAANKIVELIPELKEGDNFSKFASDNISYLREVGFTPDEINEAVDDRALLMADKARKWDALQRSKIGLPEKKVVPKSTVRAMTTDASSSDAPSTPRLRSGASRDQRVDFVLKELMKG